MQKRLVRGEIEFLGQPQPGSAGSKQNAPKKSWMRRHPLSGGIIIAGIASAAAFSNIRGCEGKHEKAKPALKSKSAEEEMRDRKKREMRQKINELRDIIRAQRAIIKSGWGEKRDKTEREDAAKKREAQIAEEKQFRLDIDDKSRAELLALLSEQENIIDELRAEYGREGPESIEERDALAHEEIKRGDIKDKLDEKEMEDRGLLNMAPEELREILIGYDSFAIRGNEHVYGVGRDIEENRRLVIKAINWIEEEEVLLRYGTTKKS